MRSIPYGRQEIDSSDLKAVVEALQSDWLTQGPTIAQFEEKVAAYCGAKYAVAVSNATAALHLACLAAGLGKEDRLWTSPNTFVASANCALYCGAQVDFVDIDPRTYNLSLEQLTFKLEQAERRHRLPQILIPVHFAGQSCAMKEMHELSRRYSLTLIEDASHAIGGKYLDSPIGSCRYSDMAVFSFHPVKIITTGEGGMILTNREDLYEKLLRLRTHGITRARDQMVLEDQGPWYYEQIELGFNYRMTDFQAALGISQMKRLDQFVERRHFLARRYDHALEGLPLATPWQDPNSYSSYHLYPIALHREKIKKTRRQIFEELREKGIGVNVHYIPVHLQPYYQALGFKTGDFPQAEQYYASALTLPLYPQLTEADQDRIIQVLKEALR